ncbi:MAG: efflux RND transporter periplasmic adaptor subunit, partial [Bacteroidales bacterium]
MKIQKLSVLFFATAILFFYSCDSKQDETTEEAKALVEVKTVEQSTFVKELEYTGVVQAWEDAFIGAASPARIEKIYVDVGDRVKKGQKVVQMDRTHLYQAKVQMDNLKNDMERMKVLLEEGAVTQQNYDQLKAQYEIAESNYNNLAVNTEIKSTLDGVVTGRYYSDGEIFSMSPGPAGKPAIISVDQLHPVKVLVGVSEKNFTNVK